MTKIKETAEEKKAYSDYVKSTRILLKNGISNYRDKDLLKDANILIKAEDFEELPQQTFKSIPFKELSSEGKVQIRGDTIGVKDWNEHTDYLRERNKKPKPKPNKPYNGKVIRDGANNWYKTYNE